MLLLALPSPGDPYFVTFGTIPATLAYVQLSVFWFDPIDFKQSCKDGVSSNI